MILFLIVFLTIYGGMHYFLLRRIRSVFTISVRAKFVILLGMTVLCCLPLCIRLLERSGLHGAAMFAAHIGYFWMGMLFIFIWVSLLIDGILLVLRGMSRIRGGNGSFFDAPQRIGLYGAALTTVLIAGYGYWEALDVRTETVYISTDKLPPTIEQFTLVQISDVHLGLIVRESRLRKIVRKIQESKPDLLVSTGDLVDGQLGNIEGMASMLADVRPTWGKFAVTGNHEYYAGIDSALSFTRQAGFVVLRGDWTDLTDYLTIAGVDDPVETRTSGSMPSERKLLANISRDRFTVLLKHRPAIDPGSIDLFDLQLSGHVHKGQIAPFNLITSIVYPVKTGLTVFGTSSALYVSRGTGTWGPPLRFLTPPEITVVHLVRANRAGSLR